MGAGSSGKEAYRMLVSELRRELDTRVCGAALHKLIAFRAGEGVPFSDCYRRFRTVVHDAKSDGEFAGNFNSIQSIVSVLMSQQYPTLYEITFPRNAPNKYFLDEAQMGEALDPLKRNVTRSLPPRSDAGLRGSRGRSTSGVDSSSAKIASKSNAARIPESIMNVKRDVFRANFHRGQLQSKRGTLCITFDMIAIRHCSHDFLTPKPSQPLSGGSLNNV